MSTEALFERIGFLAKQALIDEVSATPKPGLVDRKNSGAHKDMDIGTFRKSANTLESYFTLFAKYGHITAKISEQESFAGARKLGIKAERAMLDATNGVNTHKGSIFSVGLICMAAGRLLALEERVCIENICKIVSATVKGICVFDCSAEKSESQMTNGERMYKNYGIKGIRGEAESGFLTVRSYSYPFMLSCFEKGLSKNETMVRTVIYLMSVTEDTNVLSRGGKEGAEYVRQKASELYNSSFDDIIRFDKELIEKNLSPGGCADLLAVTWFIYSLQKDFRN